MNRWVIHAEAGFDARHALTSYRGEKETPHSHAWKVAVRVGTEDLNEEGFALDFHEVRAILDASVEPLEGSDLNRHPKIGVPSPTAERIAMVLADGLAPELAGIGGRLLSISVWEGAENRVDLVLDGGVLSE